VSGLLLLSVWLLAADVLAAPGQEDRGICLLVNLTTSERVLELVENTGLTILVQCFEQDDVQRLQRELDESHVLGSRVYVSWIEDGRLCLADNLATVVFSVPNSVVSRDELMRVLKPRGRLVEANLISVKPVPEGTGDWTHPYQDAANNPQASDQLAKAPYLTKFLSAPYYGPMPEITVSSGGRLFKAFGHLAFKEREWPMLGKLVAMDAYNGTMLWQRDMEPGFMIHRNTIVATDDTLYLADHVSCKLIDAATGEVKEAIVVPEGISDGPVWKWMTIRDGVLYALVGENEQLHKVHQGTLPNVAGRGRRSKRLMASSRSRGVLAARCSRWI
jgi:hypothetical protein